MIKDERFLLFPAFLWAELAGVLSIIPQSKHAPMFEDTKINLRGESLLVDCRLYNDLPSYEDTHNMSLVQRLMLSALYTKHHNGYLRELHLDKLFNHSEYWIPPFIFHLIGEHVPEITEKIYSFRHVLYERRIYREFADENPDYMQLQLQRCISYWHAYNRGKYPDKESFPGVEFITSFIKKS